jgi:hypothetical protein
MTAERLASPLVRIDSQQDLSNVLAEFFLPPVATFRRKEAGDVLVEEALQINRLRKVGWDKLERWRGVEAEAIINPFCTEGSAVAARRSPLHAVGVSQSGLIAYNRRTSFNPGKVCEGDRCDGS